MSTMIGKFVVPVLNDEWFDLELPCRGEVLGFGCQSPDTVCFWLEFDPEDHKHTSSFRVYGTGMTVADDAEHCATVMWETTLVWHLYKKITDARMDELADTIANTIGEAARSLGFRVVRMSQDEIAQTMNGNEDE